MNPEDDLWEALERSFVEEFLEFEREKEEEFNEVMWRDIEDE